MSVIFPAGRNKLDWSPDPEKAEKKLQKKASVGDVEVDEVIEPDAQFDAIKDLPFVSEQAGDMMGDLEGHEEAESPAVEVAEEKVGGGVVEEVEKAVEKAKDAIDVVVEKVEEVVHNAPEVKEVEKKEEGEKKEDGKKDEVVIDLPAEDKKEDEVTVDISVDEAGDAKIDDIPGGTVGKDGKESDGKCAEASKKEPFGGKKAEPFGKKEEKKDEKCEEKDEKKGCDEGKKASADDKSKFLKLADCSPEVIKDVSEYWLALGFPAEYVKAMTKNY
jgi:hypothetical protein